MRVLFVVHDFLPAITAGVEVNTLLLAQELGCRGHAAGVFHAEHDLTAPENRLRTATTEGLPCWVLNRHALPARFTGTYADPAVDSAFAACLRDFQPDIVHFQHIINLSLTMAAACRAGGVPAVLTLHDYWLLCGRGGQMRRASGGRCEVPEPQACAACLAPELGGASIAERAVLGQLHRVPAAVRERIKRALGRTRTRLPLVTDRALRALARKRRRAAAVPDGAQAAVAVRSQAMREFMMGMKAVISPSFFLRERFAAAGFDVTRLRVIKNGVPPAPARAKPPAAGEPPRIGFVGTPSPAKGFDVFVAAARRVPEIHAVIWGDTGIFPAYTAPLLAELPPHIEVAGAFHPRERDRVFGDLHAVCVPSVWWENAPLTILEARAFGLPVIASGIGGMAEHVRGGVDGLLVPPGDVEALAGAFHALAHEPGLWRRLAEGVETPPTIARQATQYLEVYEGLGGEGV